MERLRICKSCQQRLLFQRRAYSTHEGRRDYNAAVIALNSLQSNFAIVQSIKKLGPGRNKLAVPQMIERVQRIGYEPSAFDRLNPIHVAGTKGKGSTSSFIASILAQYLPTKKSIHAERLPSSVGLYTSPHLRYVRERIQINGQPISETAFAQYFWEVWDRLAATEQKDISGDGDKLVYFHFLTLMALHCYMQENVGTAVIECGVGGEYDTTNVLQNPSVTAVTSLGIDHESLLGNTIESIAWHKAGIFKKGVPAFAVPQPQAAMQVLRDRAIEKDAELHIVPRHTDLESIQLGLQGEFQKINASLAIAVSAAHLQRLGFTNIPDPLDSHSKLPNDFVKGLQSARLGGRCDMRPDVKNEHLTWFIDGGHTLESVEVAGQWFAASTPTGQSQTSGSQTKKILIFNQQTRDASVLARKLYVTLATVLQDPHPFEHAIFCTNSTYKGSGYKADLMSINTNKDDIDALRVQRELATTWDDIDPHATVQVVATIEEAVNRARQLAETVKTEVLVTGSLHLVGGLIEVLESEIERKHIV